MRSSSRRVEVCCERKEVMILVCYHCAGFALHCALVHSRRCELRLLALCVKVFDGMFVSASSADWLRSTLNSDLHQGGDSLEQELLAQRCPRHFEGIQVSVF